MDVLIYGSGAVGLGLASCLIKSKNNVCFIARPDTAAQLQQKGLVRTGIFGRYDAGPESFSAYKSLDELTYKNFDFILVCVKSFDSSKAAQDISMHKEILGQNTKIVLCQNGWANAEKFTKYFPKEQIYSARVITGFRRSKANEVEITVHADSIHIGSLFGGDVKDVRPLADSISKGDIPAETVLDIEKDLWAKMMYNCALNPLGAILDVPYGLLAKDSNSRNLMNHIIKEIFDVMSAAGFQTHWKSADGFLEIFYDKLVPDTAKHKSSTLQDIAAGKKTEIDSLTGAVLNLADKHKLEVPYNASVFSIIKFVEARRMG